MKLYAWIGEDEFGSGFVGLKQARVPAGYIPLVAIEKDRHKLEHPKLVAQLRLQAATFGKSIRFVEFTLTQDNLITLDPS